MSGDIGPSVTLPAALQALTSNPRLKLLLVGKTKIIQKLLKKANSEQISRIEIIHAEHIVLNNIKPLSAIRQSKETSMRIAIDLVKNGYAKACVSSGNTAVLIGLSKLMLKLINGIKRPALMTIIPNIKKKQTILLDLGANINCTSEMLIQFAIMGSVVAEEIINIIKPKVALLNIGKEENKGLDNIQKAAAILKKITSINYIGYAEGDDLLIGKTDVLVCDGFIGNVLLKTMEGVIRVIFSFFKSTDKTTNNNYFIQLIKKILIKKITKHFFNLNPDQYNGAIILGLKNIVIKSHGSANEKAFKSAIDYTIRIIQKQIPEKITDKLNILSLRSIK
ncbi:Phosphate acyltransferase [Candidatus Providencia siddallii]|uniref:Phosphate acyltransferase n=2 Tax=Candidatus Providencia siddallii TaxID=1715285 RepID=A0ABP1CFI4_9GAMM